MGSKLSVVILTAIAEGLIKVAKHFDPLYIFDLDIQNRPEPGVPVLKVPSGVVDTNMPGGEMMVKNLDSGVTPENIFNVVDETADNIPLPPITDQVAAAPVELDSEGLPWDTRIDASSKKKLTRGGTWKLKRGIDPAFVEKVKAELKSLMAVPATTPMDSSPVFNSIDVAAPPPSIPPLQPHTLGIPPPPSGSIITLSELMGAALKAKKKPSDLEAACKACGIASVPLLAARLDLIPAVAKALGV